MHSGALSLAADKRVINRLCGSLLIVATIVLSGRFACAVPFAALAALTAVSTDRRSGFILMTALWFSNQVIGFALLDYPLELSCVGGGLMLGISALLSLFGAQLAIYALRRANAFIQAGAALVCAFCAYEGGLYAGTVATASNEGAFCAPVIEQIAVLNAGSFAVLFCLYRALLAAGVLRRSALPTEGRELKPQTA